MNGGGGRRVQDGEHMYTFTTKMDGTLDIWDFVFKQCDPALSLKVTCTPLPVHPRPQKPGLSSCHQYMS